MPAEGSTVRVRDISAWEYRAFQWFHLTRTNLVPVHGLVDICRRFFCGSGGLIATAHKHLIPNDIT